MGSPRKLTRDMLVGAVLACPPDQRKRKDILAALKRMFNITIDPTRLSRRMNDWGIRGEIDKRAREETEKAVAAGYAAVEVAKLNSNIGTINQAETVIGRLLERAMEILTPIQVVDAKGVPQEGHPLIPRTPDDLKTLQLVLESARELMLASSAIRKDMSEIALGDAGHQDAEERGKGTVNIGIFSVEEIRAAYPHLMKIPKLIEGKAVVNGANGAG